MAADGRGLVERDRPYGDSVAVGVTVLVGLVGAVAGAVGVAVTVSVAVLVAHPAAVMAAITATPIAENLWHREADLKPDYFATYNYVVEWTVDGQSALLRFVIVGHPGRIVDGPRSGGRAALDYVKLTFMLKCPRRRSNAAPPAQ